MTSVNEEAAQLSESQTVNRVAVRVPPFWAEKPTLWFSQLEGQFVLSGITADATKFYYVVSQLEKKYAEEVEEIITNPPETNKYATLKDQLVKRLSTSREQRLRQLLEHEEMGDRTPSQFLRHLRQLAGDSVQDEFLRTLWENRLPSYMRPILATQADSTLSRAAELADRINEARPQAQCAATTSEAQVAKLVQEMAGLRAQIAEFSRSRTREQTLHHKRGRSQSRRSRAGNSEPDTCWYHAKFGTSAKKCRPPCKFSENLPGSR